MRAHLDLLAKQKQAVAEAEARAAHKEGRPAGGVHDVRDEVEEASESGLWEVGQGDEWCAGRRAVRSLLIAEAEQYWQRRWRRRRGADVRGALASVCLG